MKKRILAGMMMGIMVLASAMSVSAAPSTEDFAEVVVPEASGQGDYKEGDYVILDEKEEFQEFESEDVMTKEAQETVEAVIETVFADEVKEAVEKALEEAIKADSTIKELSEEKKQEVVKEFKEKKVKQMVESYVKAAEVIKKIDKEKKQAGKEVKIDNGGKIDKELKDKKIVKSFFDLHATGAKKEICHTDGSKHKITIGVPGMTRGWKNIIILHYSTIRCVWETIVPVVDYDKKTLTFETYDLSPLAIYADIVEDGAEAEKPAQTSPATGSVSSAWMIWSAMALIVLGAGAIVSQKKRG